MWGRDFRNKKVFKIDSIKVIRFVEKDEDQNERWNEFYSLFSEIEGVNEFLRVTLGGRNILYLPHPTAFDFDDEVDEERSVGCATLDLLNYVTDEVYPLITTRIIVKKLINLLDLFSSKLNHPLLQ